MLLPKLWWDSSNLAGLPPLDMLHPITICSHAVMQSCSVVISGTPPAYPSL